MLAKLRNITQHPLISGSLIMLVGTNFASFLAYIFHLIFGRLLGPASYGELVAITSVAGLFMSTFTFLGVSVIKLVSSGTEETRSDIYTLIKRRLYLPVGIISLLVIFATPLLSSFLKIEPRSVFLLGPIIFFAFLHRMYSSFLQGKTEFKKTVMVNNFAWVTRIIFGVSLFYLGFALFGVVISYLVGFIASWLVGQRLLGSLDVKKVYDKMVEKEFFKFSLPALVMTLSISSFVSTDVILVKHFFDAHSSGIYSSLSTLGKVIYYVSFPIAGAIFPLVSEKSSKHKSTKYLFLLNFLLGSLISGGVLFVYWLFPEVVVELVYGSEYLQAAPYILWFGLFVFVFAANFILVNYYLSRDDTKAAYLVLIGALLQVFGIFFFHTSLMSIILVNLLTACFVFVSLITYGLVKYGFVFKYSELKRGVNQFKKEI